jgi:uncharacterized protein
MLRDPLTAYVSQHGGAEDRLVELAESKYDPSTAEDAFRQFIDAAKAGSSFAMCICSRLLREGRGTSQSPGQALLWAEQAANAGFAPGIYELARCYEYGVGVKPDIRKAAEIYERSASAGYGFAAHRLGRAYYLGEIGIADISKAVEYMKRAYELGDFNGAHDLAEWHESGERLRRDHGRAVLWYERASELGDPFATVRLQFAYSIGELGLPKNPELARKYEELSKIQTSQT